MRFRANLFERCKEVFVGRPQLIALVFREEQLLPQTSERHVRLLRQEEGLRRRGTAYRSVP